MFGCACEVLVPIRPPRRRPPRREGGGSNSEAAAPSTEEDDPSSVTTTPATVVAVVAVDAARDAAIDPRAADPPGGLRPTRSGDRGGAPRSRRPRPRSRPSLAAKRVSDGGYGEGKRGCGHHRTNDPPEEDSARSAAIDPPGSRRPARRPPRNGGRGGRAVVDADTVFAAAEVATAEASVAVAVVDS